LAALPATSSDLTESYQGAPKPLRQRRPWSGGSSWLEVAEQPAGERGKALLLARACVDHQHRAGRVGIARCSGLGWRWARGHVLGVLTLGSVPPLDQDCSVWSCWSPASAGQTSATAGGDMLESPMGVWANLACLHRLERSREERIPSPLTVGSDLGKRRSAQRLALDT
jgi:hypothetical protein